jgi:hypothetical protein
MLHTQDINPFYFGSCFRIFGPIKDVSISLLGFLDRVLESAEDSHQGSAERESLS